VTDVLLVTSSGWPDGEPGAPALDRALAARGIASRWVVWDDPAVDWADARLVAVRSTWDYTGRYAEFVAWARDVEAQTPLLNGADVFAWNVDKSYLSTLGDVPAVPTVTADDVPALQTAVASFGRAVVKPRIGAGGAGVIVVDDPADPRLGTEIDDLPGISARGPWVVQPLVESVRTEGETSVFVLGGQAVSQVDKLPAGDEIRVHEHFGGSSRPVPLRDEAAELAFAAFAAAAGRLGRNLDYGRADMMRLADGTLAISELELVEPGLYLDVIPANAEPFADVVRSRL
jgi:glutathione synthase/RimK-type ligase-like ATP-grasp enzyme